MIMGTFPKATELGLRGFRTLLKMIKHMFRLGARRLSNHALRALGIT